MASLGKGLAEIISETDESGVKVVINGEDVTPQYGRVNPLQDMLDMQKALQAFLGYDFDNMSIQDRVKYIKEFSIHLNQEINEALYELPFFKPWKDYSGMSDDEIVNALVAYKKEIIDAWHFFMNMMLLVDFQADEFAHMYYEKNAENIERQKRGYTHDVSYREEQNHE